MKHDDELVRIRKLAVVFAVVSLLLFCALAAFFIYEVTQVKAQVRQLEIRIDEQYQKIDTDKLSKDVAAMITIPNIADGKDGRDGIDGEDGADGRDGQDSKSVHTREVIEKETVIVEQEPIPGPQGPQGEKGDPAPRIVIAKDSNGDLIWKQADARFWELIPKVEIDL